MLLTANATQRPTVSYTASLSRFYTNGSDQFWSHIVAGVDDWRPENETTLIANAQKSFQPQQIVIGHANLPAVTHCYAQLLDIIQSRDLQTVTLNDVFT